jgi:peptidoglycan-associated lipoprotein
MNNLSKALKGRLRLATALCAGVILAGCASQVPLESSSATVSTATTGQAPSQAGQSAQGGAVSREIAAAKAALSSVEPSVYFDLDRFEIKPQYQGTITAFANYLKADSKARIVIEGHADERGTTEYNLALGQKRAEAVGKAMGILGVAANRVEAVSFGEEKPRAQGSNEQAWAQNRRADLVLR